MIPKIIHYCWFGGNELPKRLSKCLESWKQLLSDYKFMRWDENSFDINSTEWTNEAYTAKKYAFVSDYVRLVALEKYGGIYLDTDVLLKKSFDHLLDLHAFMGFENDLYLTSAVIGCEAHFPLIQEFLAAYSGKHFYEEDGKPSKEANVVMMTEICKKHGLRIDDTSQIVSDMHVFPRAYFCPLDFYHNDWSTEDTIAVHYFDASWLDRDTKKMVLKERTMIHKAYIKFKEFIRNILRKGLR